MTWISGLKPRFENQVQTWKQKTWKWEAEFQVYFKKSNDGYYHQIEKKWEISRSNLMLDKVIGEGEFGRVMSGRLLEKSLASGTFETTFIIHPKVGD